MNQVQEYLHDANRRLLCEYSEAKLHLLYLQAAPIALENAEELNALCNEVVLKDKAPPVCEDYSDQASLLANNDLLEVNTELQNLNNAMSQDIAMLEKKFNEVFSQNPQKKSQSSTSLSNIGEAADLETAPGHAWVDNVLCNREEKRADRAMRDQIRMIRALQKSLEALQEQLDQTEKLKSFSVTTIEELQEQKEVLQEKVKTLEQMQKKSKEPKLQRGKHRRQNTIKRLEQEEWKEQCTLLNRQMCEARDRADFLKEQLSLTRWMNDFYKTVIDEIMEDSDTLSGRKNILKDRLKSSRSKLCRCFYRLFCPRTRWYKDDVSVLLRKKSEITTKALDLGEQLQFARQFLSIHEDLEKGLSLEINQLEERLTGLKGWLRDGNAFLFGRKNKKEEDDRILRKQECEVKGRLKGLRKKLADAHDSKNSYNSVIARIEQEQEKINKKMRKIEEKLLKC
ncbi:unnamed protein product [Tetraodon nigroviridis]|uniref:Chromosome 7 SCAF14557, whole genome shotgun sequence n=1 Tax=Tetraodon nigroviridis TaxID=99883 RepID=Q4SLB9_TETNG|nr:unnamed protein product [Tetraodon nigroviridis]